MKLNPAQIARLEIHMARTKSTLTQLNRAGANQFGHGLNSTLTHELKRSGDAMRGIARNIGHTRNSLQVSKYKREVWGDRQRRQSHSHGVDRLEGKLQALAKLVEELIRTTKQRDDPNGGLFDLSKDIADGFKQYEQVISVDVRNDLDTVSFQNADMAADPIQGVIMLVGLGLELWRLYGERRKKDREFKERNPNWS